ncbi:MAG: AvrD family protein [Micrococcales bacterium]|nr:AvrD family protein [Micrococcales bacterium]
MPQHFASVDDVLGEAESRYFGVGHSRVEYSFSDYAVTSTARCSAEINGTWSQKGEQQQVPHASTLDAMVMANTMAERHCLDVLNYSESKVARLFPARVTVRAGSEPSPIDGMHLSASLEQVASLNPAELVFRVMVASLEVRLVLVEIDPSRLDETELVGSALSGDVVRRPRETRIENLVLSDDAAQVEAAAYVQQAKIPPAQYGLGWQVSDRLQLTEALLVCAQVCQVMIYQHDQIDRAESENLWMRRIEIELFPDRPLRPGQPTVIQGAIDRVTDVPLGEKVFRSFRVSGGSGHLRCSANIAHALPPRTLAELMRSAR